jgi:hypothetical protein
VDTCVFQPLVHPEVPIEYQPPLPHQHDAVWTPKFRESRETKGQV